MKFEKGVKENKCCVIILWETVNKLCYLKVKEIFTFK